MNGHWKWIAGILAALIVGFLPGYITGRNSPTSSQFQELQRSQQQMQVQLAVLTAQNKSMMTAFEDARRRIIAIQTQR